MSQEDIILEKYQMLAPELNERTLRIFAAAEAMSLGRGGISIVSRSLEISRDRISRGIKDIESKKKLYPDHIRRKGGGSNSSRNRLWKVELQKMANQTGLTITVCHFPPGTSKWNKIEHRMFSFITRN